MNASLKRTITNTIFDTYFMDENRIKGRIENIKTGLSSYLRNYIKTNYLKTATNVVNSSYPEKHSREFHINQSRRMQLEIDKEIEPLLEAITHKTAYIICRTGFI